MIISEVQQVDRTRTDPTGSKKISDSSSLNVGSREVGKTQCSIQKLALRIHSGQGHEHVSLHLAAVTFCKLTDT